MSSSTSYSITLLCLVFFLVFSSFSLASTVTYDHRSLIIDGQRKLLLSASIHYPRSVPAMWPGLIKTAKEGGNNAIDTYVFWNGHELSPGNVDVYSEAPGACAAFLSSTDKENDKTVIFQNVSYHLPAWSVSILLDCKNVSFNTAKVVFQSSTIEMIPENSQASSLFVYVALNDGTPQTLLLLRNRV